MHPSITSEVDEICHVVFTVVIREIFIRAVRILAATVTYLIVLHLLVKQHFPRLMSIVHALEWQVRGEILIVNHSECVW